MLRGNCSNLSSGMCFLVLQCPAIKSGIRGLLGKLGLSPVVWQVQLLQQLQLTWHVGKTVQVKWQHVQTICFERRNDPIRQTSPVWPKLSGKDTSWLSDRLTPAFPNLAFETAKQLLETAHSYCFMLFHSESPSEKRLPCRTSKSPKLSGRAVKPETASCFAWLLAVCKPSNSLRKEWCTSYSSLDQDQVVSQCTTFCTLFVRKLRQKIGGGAKNRWVEMVEMAEGTYCAESNALSTQVEDCKVSQVLEFDCHRLPSGDEDSLDIHCTSNTSMICTNSPGLHIQWPKVRSEWSVTWCELDPPVLEAFNACSSRHLFFLKWSVMIPIDSPVTSVYISNSEVGIQWLNPKEKMTKRYNKSFTMQLWIKLEAKSFHGLRKAAGVPQEFPSVRVMTCIGWFRLLTAWVRSRRRDQDSFHG